MARNQRVIDAPASAVFAVLSDPRSYDDFVVGSKRIRRFEPTWPDVGSVFHHTLGVGPFILRDLTRVEQLDQDRRLVLRAQMRPLSVNRVSFTLRPDGERTDVEVDEYPIEGPARAVWNPGLDALMWLRNYVMLRRLNKAAQRRRTQQVRAERR